MQAVFTQQVEGRTVVVPLRFAGMNYKKESGRRLKAAREDKRLTLGELSKRLGGLLSPSRLSNYEQGTRMIGVRESLALASVLGVQASYLLCVDVEGGEMTPQENDLLRNFRALPERDRNEYSRRIEVLALAYREPVPDERLSSVVRKGTGKRRNPA
jgi:transcriptional regulator with XRE-family HTH domain